MGPSGKWIDGICPDGGVEDAARRSLDARLMAVNHWLPLAAYLAGRDVENVHRLRVSTRRAVVAVRLYRDWLPRKPARQLKKRLKQIRRAAGDARDLDVLGERLARDYGDRAAPVVAVIVEERTAVQPAIADIAERCRRDDRFVRKSAKLLAGIRPPEARPAQPMNFRDWAAAELRASAAQFFAAMPSDTVDTAALHRFRIRAKALRYTIELVAPAFGPEVRGEHYPVVEKIQEHLGQIQDHVTAGARLSKWADHAKDNGLQDVLCEIAAEEAVRLSKAIGEFRDWWSAERAERLRAGLARATCGDAATPRPLTVHQM